MSYRMPDDMRLGKVKLKVSNLQRSLHFYQAVVGLQILRQDDQSAQLTSDGKNILVELIEIENALITAPRSVCGLYHFAILLPTRKDLGIVLSNLLENKIHVGSSDHLVSEALYISDPDLNGIEIYRDRPRSEWQYDQNNEVIMGGEPIDMTGLLGEAEGSKRVELPAGAKIGHVHLHIGDLQLAREFYCDLLGFDLMMHIEEFRAIFISAGGYHHHLGLNIWAGQGAPPASEQSTGLDYFTIILSNEAELKKIHKQLNDHNIPTELQGEAVFVTDPFGINIKLLAS